jgi:uncharacterized protein (DUF58 family)
MREALRGLTTRGRSFLAAGAATFVSMLILGEKDLLRVALLLFALPLLSAAYVGRSRYKLSCTRDLQPHRVPVGATARIVLRLRNVSRLPTGTLLLEDRLPYALGSRPRLVLERLAGALSSSVAYTVRADTRGRYQVGPLVVRLTDPFGLCELHHSFPSLDKLTVVPQVVPLPTVRLAGEFAGTGDSRARSVAVHGEDDAATREYRRGDDLRRVHWRSTAKVGELMVRREEQPWDSHGTVLLDTRSSGHRGEGPTSSFEWAVSAAASIAVHLAGNGFKLRLVTGATDTVGSLDHAGEGVILDHLADVRTSQRDELEAVITSVRNRSDSGLVIGIFGMLGPTDADRLAALRTNNSVCVAFLIDSSTWLNLPTQAREEADRAHTQSALALLRTGWRVVEVQHGSGLAMLWPLAARGQQGFAYRAAMAETVSGGAR